MFFKRKPVFVGAEVVNRYTEILHQAGCMEFLRGFVEKDTEKFLRLPIISDDAAKSIQKFLQVTATKEFWRTGKKLFPCLRIIRT